MGRNAINLTEDREWRGYEETLWGHRQTWSLSNLTEGIFQIFISTLEGPSALSSNLMLFNFCIKEYINNRSLESLLSEQKSPESKGGNVES